MAEVTAFRNNALPYPVYGAPWTVVFPMLDEDGDPVTGLTCDSEISKNGDTGVDCENEATEIPYTTATNKGMYYLTLTATEMTADIVAITVYSGVSTTQATCLVFYPRKLVTLVSGTSQGGAVGYITLAAATVAFDNQFNGCLCVATIDTNEEVRVLQACTSADQQCTVTPEWNIAPDADDTYIVYLPEGMQIPTVNVIAISDDLTAATKLEAVLDGNGVSADVDLTARSLTITNDAGVGVAITGTTIGLDVNATGGVGVDIDGTTSGVTADGAAGAGLHVVGTTFGLEAAASAGPAVSAVSTGGHGIHAGSSNAGSDGINAYGNTSGDGMHLLAGATGHGLSTQGGATSGMGLFAAAQDGNGHGILCRGDATTGGTGDGLRIEGGAAGHGLHASGGAESGAGIIAEAQANNAAGMELVKHGTGKDIDADEIDNILDDTGTTGVVIVDGGITAAKIAGDAITAAKIAAGAIDNATFAADVGTTVYADNHIALAADKAILHYDGPTDAEMLAAHVTTDALITTVDGIVDGIYIDTAVIGALGAGLTAIPWNSSWDAEVQSEVNDALIANNLDHLMLTAVAAETDLTAEVVDNTVLSLIIAKDGDTSTFDSTTDALEMIRNAAQGGGGGGGSTATITIKDTNTSGDVVAGVSVYAYDSGNTNRRGTGLTDALGVATINLPGDGTYKIRVYKSNWSQSTNPETLTLSGDTADEYYMTTWAATPPSGSTTTTLFGTIRTGGGVDYSGVEVKARQVEDAYYDANDVAISTEEVSADTDVDGYFELTLVRGATYKVYCKEIGLNWRTIVIAGATLDLEEALD